MTTFLTMLINGALVGLLYGMVAIGFGVIYRCSRVFNLAQGEFVVLGGFLVWFTVVELALPLYAALPLAFALAALAGFTIERVFFSRLIGESVFAMVMMTIALLIFLRGAVLVTFGPQVRTFPAILPTKPFMIEGVLIIGPLLYGGMIAIVLGICLSLFFNRTRLGLSLTAVAEDHQTALDLGISVKNATAVAWVLGMLIATLGAITHLNGKSINFLASDIGFIAIPVALLAGLESIGGMLLAGALVGIAEKLTAKYVDPLVGASLGSVLPFVLMLLVLALRPTGFFGWKTIERI